MTSSPNYIGLTKTILYRPNKLNRLDEREKPYRPAEVIEQMRGKNPVSNIEYQVSKIIIAIIDFCLIICKL